MKTNKKGFFKPKNPQKYKGNPNRIVFRSSWELKMMDFFDKSPNIISWQSEEKAIAYRSPVDNKIHRYYPDFIIEIKNQENKIETIIIEVKPFNQTTEPRSPKDKNNKKFLKEVMTYGVNNAKWEAAKFYCEKRGWKFKILTEKEIFGPKYKTK